MTSVSDLRALVFDVFGICVDWRTSVAREVAAIANGNGVSAPAVHLVHQGRGGAEPAGLIGLGVVALYQCVW